MGSIGFFCFCFLFGARVSLCSPGCLRLPNLLPQPPASVGLQECAVTCTGHLYSLKYQHHPWGQSSLPFFLWSQPPFTDLSHSLSFSYKTECRLQTLPSCPSSWLSFFLQPCAVIWHLHSHGPVPCLSQPRRTQSSAFPITISRLLESTGKSANRANWYHPRFMVPDFSLACGPQWSASVLNLLPLQLPGGPLSHL